MKSCMDLKRPLLCLFLPSQPGLTLYFVKVSTVTRQTSTFLVCPGDRHLKAQKVLQPKAKYPLKHWWQTKSQRPSKNGLLLSFNLNQAFLNLIQQHFPIIITGISWCQMTFWRAHNPSLIPYLIFRLIKISARKRLQLKKKNLWVTLGAFLLIVFL